MIPRAIGVGLIVLGLGRAAAQTAADTMAAVAVTTDQEKTMAGQAQGVTHAALGAVFGAVHGAGPAATSPVEAAQAATAPVAPPLDAAPSGGPADGTVAAVAPKGRDPFRPFTLDLRPDTQDSQILTPLQRYELPQLRLAGVVLDLTPPRAMLQDNSGMGFIVTPGTPIGRRRGVVKAIESRRVVVEEHVLDYYGREQIHQVVIEMPKDDKPQSPGQE